MLKQRAKILFFFCLFTASVFFFAVLPVQKAQCEAEAMILFLFFIFFFQFEKGKHKLNEVRTRARLRASRDGPKASHHCILCSPHLTDHTMIYDFYFLIKIRNGNVSSKKKNHNAAVEGI